MEYIYTALLLHSAGKEINEANVKKVIEGAGIKPDDAKVKALVSALEGVNIDEVIKQAAMPVAVAAPAAAPAEAKQEKKEAPAEDKSKEAEEAVSGLASLFG
ncbi:MAG: 50S ribosomal protein P1 [Candidatus Aenigmarchaeota archaeon]|nr:50S ribosomal protein P1 [Candidatus Aenigmarchaeota archaeon]MBU5689043.1 50S ribosomal protein P1 [Candidatus Aenigmarchaeota archaeon]